MKNSLHLCEGCRNYERYTLCNYSPSINIDKNKLICPYINCLVKMICVEACEPLYIYTRNFTFGPKSLLRV